MTLKSLQAVRARAPLRLGLAGGGTDVSPFCDEHGGLVLNATIDRYAYATLRPLDEPRIRFVASDQEVSCDYPLGTEFPNDGRVAMHKAVYREVMLRHNGGVALPMELTTYCDAPAGSGLGSSSTLVVAMLTAFSESMNLAFDDYELASLAFKIERIDCGLMGGRQDQYTAAFGGFNFMEFYADHRAVINQLRVRASMICELEASIVLFYTGVSRESAKIIADQSQGVASGSVQALDAMQGLKREALVMKECLLKGDMEGIVQSMRLGWESKKRSARSVSTVEMNRIFDSAVQAGALAGKVSGAGGGGFMMFIVDPARRMEVIRVLRGYEGQVSNCHFTKHGSQAWKL